MYCKYLIKTFRLSFDHRDYFHRVRSELLEALQSACSVLLLAACCIVARFTLLIAGTTLCVPDRTRVRTVPAESTSGSQIMKGGLPSFCHLCYFGWTVLDWVFDGHQRLWRFTRQIRRAENVPVYNTKLSGRLCRRSCS